MNSDILEMIRLYINDNITPYTFSNTQIETFYNEKEENLYLTVAELWLIKASSFSEGNTTSFSLGNESYSFSDSKQSCLDNYKIFLNKANQNTSSLFSGDSSNNDIESTKYCNLMGGAYNAEPYTLEEDSESESD